MAFLTIAGITVEVQTSGAAEQEGDAVGERVRAFSGRMRSTVRAVKRAWQFTTGPLTPAEATTLLAAIALDADVSCGGDALGATITCQVRATGRDYIQDARQAGDFSRVLTLQLAEV